MKTPHDVPTPRIARCSSMASLILMAVAVAALAAGCIQGHDPRTDGSRVDAHPSNASAFATQTGTL